LIAIIFLYAPLEMQVKRLKIKTAIAVTVTDLFASSLC